MLLHIVKTYLVALVQAWNCCPEQPYQVEALSQEEPALEQQDKNIYLLYMLFSTAVITIQPRTTFQCSNSQEQE